MQDIFTSIKIAYLITIKYITRHLMMVFGVLALLVLLIASQLKFDLLQMHTQMLAEGLVGTYQEHDIPIEVRRLLSKSLVKPDKQGRMVPDLVSGWEINNDATIFKFQLKKDLYWADGTKVKSSDLDFGIPNVEVTFPDDQTIQFKLKESYSPFPSLLTDPIFKKGTLMGVGPYRIQELDKSRIFITKLLLQPIPGSNLPKLVIRFYPNEKTAWIGFSLGEIQSLLGLTEVDRVNNYPLARLKQQTDYSRIVTILYNNTDSVLSNRSMRQALSYSAPKITGETQAQSPIPPFSWAYNPEGKNYLSNKTEAKAAMDRAKASGGDEILQKEITLISIPQLEGIGKQIVASWRDVGINAVLRVEAGIPQQFQALLITQSIPVDPDQYFLWHKTQTKTNLTKYDKPRADKDLEDGRKLIKEDDRKEQYLDFQKTLLEDAPATFLYFPKYNVVYIQKVEKKFNQVFQLQFSDL